jgi:hypothetical protein
MPLPPASSASDRAYTRFPVFPVEPGNFLISIAWRRLRRKKRTANQLLAYEFPSQGNREFLAA